MSPRKSRKAVIYARISVSSEESVSVQRQIESAEQYAKAREWQVVGRFTDDGVSATYNKPQDRAGWRALLGSKDSFDTVIIWKLDRLARKVIDFHTANEALLERGAAVVSVENNIDMATSEGKLVANVLAVFAEYEADTISARVRAARSHMIRAGRAVGGAAPYGWRSVPNPSGGGKVIAVDPDRIQYVRGMVERVRSGSSIYSVVQWLNEVSAPLPRAAQTQRKAAGWSYSTVERLLRNPVLAGMTPFNPTSGNDTQRNTGHARGPEVLRGEDGLPLVDERLAIMPLANWQSMIRALDQRESPQARPRALKSKTSALLSGLVHCGEHGDADSVRMYRGTIDGRESYSCPKCHMTISNFEQVVVNEFLYQKGERVRFSIMEEVHEGGAAVLPRIEQRLTELAQAIYDSSDRDERRKLQDEQAQLLDLRDEKRAEPSEVVLRAVRHTQSFGEDWDEAQTVEDRRAILDDAFTRIVVRRGRIGRPSGNSVLERLTFVWRVPEDLGPIETPDDETIEAWAASGAFD